MIDIPVNHSDENQTNIGHVHFGVVVAATQAGESLRLCMLNNRLLVCGQLHGVTAVDNDCGGRGIMCVLGV